MCKLNSLGVWESLPKVTYISSGAEPVVAETWLNRTQARATARNTNTATLGTAGDFPNARGNTLPLYPCAVNIGTRVFVAFRGYGAIFDDAGTPGAPLQNLSGWIQLSSVAQYHSVVKISNTTLMYLYKSYPGSIPVQPGINGQPLYAFRTITITGSSFTVGSQRYFEANGVAPTSYHVAAPFPRQHIFGLHVSGNEFYFQSDNTPNNFGTALLNFFNIATNPASHPQPINSAAALIPPTPNASFLARVSEAIYSTVHGGIHFIWKERNNNGSTDAWYMSFVQVSGSGNAVPSGHVLRLETVANLGVTENSHVGLSIDSLGGLLLQCGNQTVVRVAYSSITGYTPDTSLIPSPAGVFPQGTNDGACWEINPFTDPPNIALQSSIGQMGGSHPGRFVKIGFLNGNEEFLILNSASAVVSSRSFAMNGTTKIKGDNLINEFPPNLPAVGIGGIHYAKKDADTIYGFYQNIVSGQMIPSGFIIRK